MLQTNEPGIGGASTQRDRDFTCKSADVVLPQNREQAVVGMLADAPRHRGVFCRFHIGIVENAKQDERIAGVVLSEVVLVQSQSQRDTGHQVVAEPRQRSMYRSTVSRNPGISGKRFCPCSGLRASTAG